MHDLDIVLSQLIDVNSFYIYRIKQLAITVDCRVNISQF